jgi:hypothetical protein
MTLRNERIDPRTIIHAILDLDGGELWMEGDRLFHRLPPDAPEWLRAAMIEQNDKQLGDVFFMFEVCAKHDLNCALASWASRTGRDLA